jgi:hypothetical protein
MSLAIDIREVLFCDDIRREDNGKALLIGVYHGDMIVSNLPANLRLSFWLQGRAKASGESSVQFRLQLVHEGEESTDDLATLDASASGLQADTPTVLVFQAVHLKVDKPAKLTLSVLDDGSWREIASKKIALASPA